MNAAWVEVNRLKILFEFGGGGDRPNKLSLKNVKLIQNAILTSRDQQS